MSANDGDLTDIMLEIDRFVGWMMLHLHDFQLNFSATLHIFTQHAELQSSFTLNVEHVSHWLGRLFAVEACANEKYVMIFVLALCVPSNMSKHRMRRHK